MLRVSSGSHRGGPRGLDSDEGPVTQSMTAMIGEKQMLDKQTNQTNIDQVIVFTGILLQVPGIPGDRLDS